ncbi:M28 family metallopeptidase [Sphingopyxis terrae]|uniref:M28 family metallopeptidase n=1 Tax=Sphingopyxis terrae TaxID=33052 RepID=UPI0007896E6C|nr:M28 family metallopeptidase [Sphingopyxis terrae]
MTLNRLIAGVVALVLPAYAVAQSGTAQDVSRSVRWWDDVKAIGSDANEGRGTGTTGHLRAVGYVERRFREIGLAPAGAQASYRQTVPLEEQTIDHSASSVSLIDQSGTKQPLALDRDMIISAYGGPRAAATEAPLVFIGYGMHLPAFGHDDFAGVDLRGKIAVAISGGPPNIPAPIKANQRKERLRLLGRSGAAGLIMLTSPNMVEIPWSRQLLLARQSQMYLSDRSLRDIPDGFFLASMAPDSSEALFAGSGHDFASLATAADTSAPLPKFELSYKLGATVTARRRRLTSPNLVAVLAGSDPRLAREYVILSAHLDHVGIGPEVDGDAIYNGAIDDGSGVASVLDIAARLAAGPRPKRSILVLIVTAEEPGLLGSTYFARFPTVPRQGLVANLNFDTLLPLWPLTEILAQGDGESSLGDNARTVAARQGLRLVPDPLPHRNSFVRTDQYSFVRAGIPALALKFGFTPGSEAFRLEQAWRANRYHAPSDDINQPGIMPVEAIRLDDYAVALAIDIANAPSRPRWTSDSIFGPPATEKGQ